MKEKEKKREKGEQAAPQTEQGRTDFLRPQLKFDRKGFVSVAEEVLVHLCSFLFSLLSLLSDLYLYLFPLFSLRLSSSENY